MEQEIIKISLKNKIVSLKISNFDTDVDTEDILSIDFCNILGEILTFSVVMNRIGNLQAEADNLVNEARMELEIKAAELGEYYRKSLTKYITVKGQEEKKVTLPTVAEVDNATLLDAAYQNTRKKYIRLQKEKQYIDSLFWSAKSKDGKLDKLSEKLRPAEFEGEILEGTINGVMIKVHNKLIK